MRERHERGWTRSWYEREHMRGAQLCYCPLARDHNLEPAPPQPDYLPPDWDVYSSCRGRHDVENIPLPHVRQFPRPDGKPRHVTMTIHSWRGYAPGASHFYVDFYTQPNPIWDGRPTPDNPHGIWVDIEDEFEKKLNDFRWRGRFTRKDHLERWIKAVLNRFDGWDVTIQDNTDDVDDRNFVYHREGD